MRVDLAQLEGALNEMKARMVPALGASGFDGVMARMQTEVTPVVVMWRAKEMNRGVGPEDMGNALIKFFASLFLSEVKAIYGDEIGDEHYEFTNRFLQALGEEIGSSFAGTSGMVEHQVDAEQGGHA